MKSRLDHYLTRLGCLFMVTVFLLKRVLPRRSREPRKSVVVYHESEEITLVSSAAAMQEVEQEPPVNKHRSPSRDDCQQQTSFRFFGLGLSELSSLATIAIFVLSVTGIGGHALPEESHALPDASGEPSPDIADLRPRGSMEMGLLFEGLNLRDEQSEGPVRLAKEHIGGTAKDREFALQCIDWAMDREGRFSGNEAAVRQLSRIKAWLLVSLDRCDEAVVCLMGLGGGDAAEWKALSEKAARIAVHEQRQRDRPGTPHRELTTKGDTGRQEDLELRPKGPRESTVENLTLEDPVSQDLLKVALARRSGAEADRRLALACIEQLLSREMALEGKASLVLAELKQELAESLGQVVESRPETEGMEESGDSESNPPASVFLLQRSPESAAISSNFQVETFESAGSAMNLRLVAYQSAWCPSEHCDSVESEFRTSRLGTGVGQASLAGALVNNGHFDGQARLARQGTGNLQLSGVVRRYGRSGRFPVTIVPDAIDLRKAVANISSDLGQDGVVDALVAGNFSWSGRGFGDDLQEPGSARFLAVGINTYNDWNFESLSYAESDARRVARALKRVRYSGHLLRAEQSDKATILRKLRAEAENGRPGDSFIFYFSGHGASDSEGRQALVTSLGETLSLAEIQAALEPHMGRVYVIVDSCFDHEGTVPSGTDRITFLLASLPGQQAFESKTLRSGLFTHTLVAALDKTKTSAGRLNFEDLFKRARVGMRKLIKKWGATQEPILIRPPIDTPGVGEAAVYSGIDRGMDEPSSSLPMGGAPMGPAVPVPTGEVVEVSTGGWSQDGAILP